MVDLWTLLSSLGHGAAMFAMTALALVLAAREGLPPAQCGALAFTALVAGNLGLILLYRGDDTAWQALRQPNPIFWIVVGATLALLVAVTWLRPLALRFGFAPPPGAAWLLALCVPLLLAVLMKASGAAMARASRRRR